MIKEEPILSLKKFYSNTRKEHIFFFLVILTALVLFNYFNFDYTGLVVKDTCSGSGYSCCPKGDGEGNYYFSLDNTCSQGKECWDYCQVNLVTTKASLFDPINDFFDNLKRGFNKVLGKEIVGAQCSFDEDCDSGEECIGGKCTSTPQTLSVDVIGSGSITGASGKINCPGDCTETYAISTTVTLVANPSTAIFTGDCQGTGTCNVNVDKVNTQVTVTFNIPPTGQCTKNPRVGLTCSYFSTDQDLCNNIVSCSFDRRRDACSGLSVADCEQQNPTYCTRIPGCEILETDTILPTVSITSHVNNQVVNTQQINLIGTANDNVNILKVQVKLNNGGWEDATLSGTTATTKSWNKALTLSQGSNTIKVKSFDTSNLESTEKTITITYDTSVRTYRLSVEKLGQGIGIITSIPTGINCGNDCAQNYPRSIQVTLTATPNSNSKFDGWSGECVNQEAIEKDVITAQAVRESNFFSNIVEFFRSLFGKISVGIKAMETCTVIMNSDKTVNAIFSLIPSTEQYTLIITKPSSGKIISADQKVKCGGIWNLCQATYIKGASVTLTATPNSGYSFASWGEDCTGTNSNNCTLILNDNKQVSATFSQACITGDIKSGTQCLVCNAQGTGYDADNSKCAPSEICDSVGQCIPESEQYCDPNTCNPNDNTKICDGKGIRYISCGAGKICLNDQCVTQPLSVPIVPSNLQATPISDSQIRLNWQDNSNNEQGFRIEGKTTQKAIVAQVIGNTFTEIAVVNANINIYTVSDLNSGKEYEFRLRAYNNNGNSVYSNTAKAMTLLTSEYSTILLVNPINEATGVNINTDINITFSQSMNKPAAQLAFSLKDTNNNPVSGTFSWGEQDKKLTFIPNSPLAKNKQYKIKITTSAKNINNIPLPNEFNSVFTTILEVKGEDDYTNGCNNNIDDDNDGVYDGLDKDCATGEKVIIKSINVQDTKPFEDSEFEIQCKIEVFGQTATLYRAQPCIIANLSTKTNSKLCEFKKASKDILRFNCDAGQIGLNKLASCEVDVSKCNGDLQDLSKNKAQKFINITSPNLCEKIIGQERLNIVEIELADKEYKDGDKIKPRLEIENLDNQDLDLEIGAYLYDINSKKQLAKNTTIKLIEEGLDSEKVDLMLITPKVSESKYKLYFKVSLKDDEDEICIQDSLDIEIKPYGGTTCADYDKDGYTDESCGGDDCDDNDEDINPDAIEVCNDLLDNNCNDLVDSDDPICSSTICTNGETKECGLNIGICKKGIQTCEDGKWGSCVGETKPVQEICNDVLDNDCDGLTDCSDSSCSTSPSCNQVGEADSDDDGLLDEWELKYFKTLGQGPYDDYDDDGFTNIQEYSENTDPTDPDSFPKESKFFIVAIIAVAVIIIAGFLIWILALKPKRQAPDFINYPKKLKSYEKSDQNTNVTLSNYIKSSLKQGYTKQQIKNALIMKGWGERDIEEAFKKL